MNTTHFLTSLQVSEYSKETLRAYKADVDLFGCFLTARRLRLNQVTLRVLDEFLRTLRVDRKLAPPTISPRLSGISAYFDYRAARSNGRVKNPLLGRGFRWPRRTPPKPQGLDACTVDAILREIPSPRDRAMFALFVASGLRISELHQLNRNSIRVKSVARQSDSMTLGIGEVIGKGKKQRTFLVEETTCEALAGLLRDRGNDGIEALFVSSRGGRLSVRAIRERFHHWCRRLGLPRFRVHQLRHTFATRMLNSGMSTLVLRELMGHSSFNTTLRYARIEDKNIARQYFAAMESLSRSGTGGSSLTTIEQYGTEN